MMKRTAAVVLACLLLASPLAALADQYDEGSPDAIRKQIEQLRIFYTDDHPDIQILKRRLDRAIKVQEQLRKDREERRRQRQMPEPGQVPDPRQGSAPPPSAPR